MYSTLLLLLMGAHAALAARFSECAAWRHHENFHLLNHAGCGRMDISLKTNSKIVGGTVASPGSLPWMAFLLIIRDKGASKCGGSIINERYILTAAHCSVTRKSYVILGLHNTDCAFNRICEPHAVEYNVQQFITHPNYNNVTKENDIALIRLDRRISFNSPDIDTICLPSSCELSEKTFKYEHFIAAGWGLLSKDKDTTTLQVVEVPMAECPQYYTINNVHVVTDWRQMCAGNRSVATCSGDSGGPLVYRQAGRAVQVGVTSLGVEDCISRTGSHFTRVSQFMGWVLDNIEP